MKKLTASGLCAFLLTLMLTACGGQSSTSPNGASSESSAAAGEEKAVLAELNAKTAPQFRAYAFTKNGAQIKYNLFGPSGMAIGKKYPLVVFLGATAGASQEASPTLPYGALVWGASENQAKNPCFVLVPQFSAEELNAAPNKSAALAMLPALIEEVATRNPVDSKKIYIAGQGAGGAAAMQLDSDRPGLFAASLFVDCQPEGASLAKLVKTPFIFFATGPDSKAAASMKGIEEACRKGGAGYTTATWSALLPTQTQEDMVATMLEKNAPVNLFTFEEAVVENSAREAFNAWRLDAARNWLFTKALK